MSWESNVELPISEIVNSYDNAAVVKSASISTYTDLVVPEASIASRDLGTTAIAIDGQSADVCPVSLCGNTAISPTGDNVTVKCIRSTPPLLLLPPLPLTRKSVVQQG